MIIEEQNSTCSDDGSGYGCGHGDYGNVSGNGDGSGDGTGYGDEDGDGDGFCGKGEGAGFVLAHDLSYRGDFPCNPHGGQLSFGQTGMAGGMHHVIDGTRQIMGRAGTNQVRNCNTAFVSGNGGIMSEQVVLILEGVRA